MGPIHFGAAREYLENDPPGGWSTRHRAAFLLWNDGVPRLPERDAVAAIRGRLVVLW